MASLGLYLKAKSDAAYQLKCNLIIVIPYMLLDDDFLSHSFLDMETLKFSNISVLLMSVSTGINLNC